MSRVLFNLTKYNVQLGSNLFYFKRCLIISSQRFKQSNIKLKGRSKSSQEWLLRQMNDPYVEKAKTNNFRCRSAFKLLEMDTKYKLLHPGQCVLDCGAAPGSWAQIAASKTNSNGKDSSKPIGFVYAVDLLPIQPLEGVHIIGRTDLSSEEGLNKIRKILNDRKIDVVLCDAAPNATGIKDLDHESIIQLAYAVARFGLSVSNVGAHLLIKIWDGRLTTKLINDISKYYTKVKRVKPSSSRLESTEIYILATDFKGSLK